MCYISQWVIKVIKGLLSCMLLVEPSVILLLFIECRWLLYYVPN